MTDWYKVWSSSLIFFVKKSIYKPDHKQPGLSLYFHKEFVYIKEENISLYVSKKVGTSFFRYKCPG